MKYRVTLHGKVYEVEVEQGEAILLDEYEAVSRQANPASDRAMAAGDGGQDAGASAAPGAGVGKSTGAGPAAPADRQGQEAGPGDGASQVKAPMPGNILDVRIQDGAAVAQGDVLCILEAMKMENEILAPCAGTVTVLAAKGMVVDTGDLLFAIA